MPIEHQKMPNLATASSSSVTSSSLATPYTSGGITAIVPARDEEAVIAACVESLAKQREITDIAVVNDQSSDKTAAIVRELQTRISKLRLLEAHDPPPGWVGKNNALTVGVRTATSEWLLFTDADVELEEGATARALQIAQETHATLVSFSPQQITEKWYEKALIRFVYCRLARRFSYAAVNDPKSTAAAANGQFLLIRRDVYEAVGGHARFASDVLEDVALAAAVKATGHRLWFGPGNGIGRARMYRTFGAMWEGWTKNLYPLMGGPVSGKAGSASHAVGRELRGVVPWIPLLLLLLTPLHLILGALGVVLLTGRHAAYAATLRRNRFPATLALYYLPAVALYAAALLTSEWRYRRGSGTPER